MKTMFSDHNGIKPEMNNKIPQYLEIFKKRTSE